MDSKRIMLMIGGAVVAILAVGTFYFTASPNGSPEQAQAQRGPQKSEYPLADLLKPGPLPELVLGSADAPNTVIEYSSMTCPHCANFHTNVLPDLKAKYIDTGKVRYIIREFPLDNLAAAAFMLARCAGPEKTIPLIELLYQKQKEWAFAEGGPLPQLRKITKVNAGITKEAFDKCLTDQKTLDKMLEVRKRGAEVFGVRSTPTFFVNGKLLRGSNSVKAFEKIMGIKPEKDAASKK